ncbi:hypothetical protein H072_1566 [Dactylellina haptotyla CBS 200.50]|uniref:RNase III domain-containing protein n=1 Tax=Dactylellina haptotyla (strain CBS 200.50) TaxID=1284197 RepID=S8ANE3_DACHA|nr:hypothetical protein H072_1566 [Dactylellina haptotyla CBS 200.50]
MDSDYTFALNVPETLYLPQISRDDLRTSALMDQTSRTPFTTRHLNHTGKYAYKLAVALHLATAYPGQPQIKELQSVMTADEVVRSFSIQFGLPEEMVVPKTPTPEYDAETEVFYAWMGAVYLEKGIEAIQLVVMSLFEANRDEILLAATHLAGYLEGSAEASPLKSSVSTYEDSETPSRKRKLKHAEYDRAVEPSRTPCLLSPTKRRRIATAKSVYH